MGDIILTTRECQNVVCGFPESTGRHALLPKKRVGILYLPVTTTLNCQRVSIIFKSKCSPFPTAHNALHGPSPRTPVQELVPMDVTATVPEPPEFLEHPPISAAVPRVVPPQSVFQMSVAAGILISCLETGSPPQFGA